VLFVVLGGLLVLRWARLAWIHVPAASWGAWVEVTGRICPLTPLEKDFRLRAGEMIYAGDFVTHYVVPVLYPSGLTRNIQLALGVTVVVLNLALYAVVLHRRGAQC
jgi:hypothetical protein